MNKLYSAGRRIENKDAIDFALLYERYRWQRAQVKNDFEIKSPSQSFEIYLGAILSVEDYVGLNEKYRKILNKIKDEWAI